MRKRPKKNAKKAKGNAAAAAKKAKENAAAAKKKAKENAAAAAKKAKENAKKAKENAAVAAKKAKENKFFKNLDQKAMKMPAKLQQELKEKEEELERTETIYKNLDKRRKELRQQAVLIREKGNQEFGKNWFFNGNHENTDLYKLKIINDKEADIALKKTRRCI